MDVRRLTALLLLPLAAAFWSCVGGGGNPTNPTKPNIIFIMADDLGYRDLGCYGQDVIQTPNLNNMAAEGIRFTQCYTGSPVCAPSRSVLMTGKHTGHTTVRGNFGKTGVMGLGGRQGRVPLKESDITIAAVLKEIGYMTGMVGKWGLGEPETSGEPGRQGFDYFYGFLNQRRAHHYFAEYVWENKEKIILEGNLDGGASEYVHDLFTNKAIQFIEENHDSTFFLYLPYTVPHAEYEIPDTTPYQDEPWTNEEKIHAAMITRLDRDVGLIFDRIKELQIDRQTIVFFCSDNGAAERWDGRFDSSGALKGRKRDLYEGGIRTPMIVRWPGKIQAGTVSHYPWYFADIFPTFATLANAEMPKNLDGINITPALLGMEKGTSRYFYWEFHERGFQQAVRFENWKVIRLAPGQTLELYDLEKDPGETTNLAPQFPEVLAQFESYLNTARTSSIDWPGVIEE